MAGCGMSIGWKRRKAKAILRLTFGVASNGQSLTFLIRMNPPGRAWSPCLGQLDHVHGWRISPLPAGPAFEGRFQFPQRRIPRSPDCIKRDARAGLTTVAPGFSWSRAARPGDHALEPYGAMRLNIAETTASDPKVSRIIQVSGRSTISAAGLYREILDPGQEP